MVSFKELANPVENVLDRPFVHGKPWSVELQHKLANPSFKEVATLNTEGKLSCASSTGIEVGPINVAGQFGIDGSAGLRLSYKSDLIRGLSLQTNLQSSINTIRQNKIGLQMEYRNDPWKLHGTYSSADQKWGFAVLGRHFLPFERMHSFSYAWDFSGTNLENAALTGAGIAYEYPVKDHVVTGMMSVAPYGKSPFGKLSFGAVSKTVGQSELGLRFNYFPSEDRSELAVGAGWILDPLTKNTSLQTRIDHNAQIAVAITHKLNSNASITFGTGFDATKKISSDSPASLGVKLTLSA